MARFYLKIASGLAGLIVAGLAIAFAQQATPTDALLKKWHSSPHANVKSESFTHWDKQGKVPVPCSTCHAGEGFRDFLGADGSLSGKIDRPAPIRSVIGCIACHNPQAQALSQVTLPSGFSVKKPGSSAVCMVCHQGRQSGANVSKATSRIEPDTVGPKLKFINIHYRAAAATLFGTQAKGGFEYSGKRYHGLFKHPEKFRTCTGCHDAHTTKVKVEACGACHNQKPLKSIRTTNVDFNGNGNTTEGIHAEVTTLHALLGKVIVAYAKTIVKKPIAYNPASYPYFFADKNGNGKVDKEEAIRKNAYASWTPRLLQAAYNYQYIAKEPGVYAHNPAYGIQLLYDSIESLNQKVPVSEFARLKRP